MNRAAGERLAASYPTDSEAKEGKGMKARPGLRPGPAGAERPQTPEFGIM